MRFILILSITILQAQSTWISDLIISDKKNGVFIKVRSNTPLKPTQVTGWFNESTSWYYMTLHQTNGDTAHLESSKLSYPVTHIECVKAGESLQIGFKMAKPVEEFEFYYANNPPELLASLRFPLSDVLVAMEQERPNTSPFQTQSSIQRPLWVKAVYFIGAGLTAQDSLLVRLKKGGKFL